MTFNVFEGHSKCDILYSWHVAQFLCNYRAFCFVAQLLVGAWVITISVIFCMSVCALHISKTAWSNFLKFSIHVTCGCGQVRLCTSDTLPDEVMFRIVGHIQNQRYSDNMIPYVICLVEFCSNCYRQKLWFFSFSFSYSCDFSVTITVTAIFRSFYVYFS